MALNTEEIEGILLDLKIEQETYAKILQEVTELEEEKKAAREGGKKKSKNEFVICVRGDKQLAEILQQGWVVQVPAESDNATLISRFQQATGDHNAASTRKKSYITEWVDFFNAIKRKFSKNHNFHIKTKDAVRVIVLEQTNVGETPVA